MSSRPFASSFSFSRPLSLTLSLRRAFISAGMFVCLGLAVALLAAGCSSSDASAPAPQTDQRDGAAFIEEPSRKVAVTASVWASIASSLACEQRADDVGFEAIIPAGADPHEFLPSVSDRTTV